MPQVGYVYRRITKGHHREGMFVQVTYVAQKLTMYRYTHMHHDLTSAISASFMEDFELSAHGTGTPIRMTVIPRQHTKAGT